MAIKHLDRLDSLHLKATGVYEPFWTDLFKRLFKPGQTFVDVGAHIGYYTTMAAEAGAGEIHAFEPDPDNFQLLVKNCYEADCYRTHLYEMAASDRTGKARLYSGAGNTGDNRLYETEGREGIEVDVTRLDDVKELADRCVDFIKIDAQGEEPRILAGARELLTRSASVVGIIEYVPKLIILGGSSPQAFFAELDALGFSVYALVGDKLLRGNRKELLQKYRKKNLFIRREGAA